MTGEPFPRELLLRLKHMIVSHHGAYEFGSPKLPMTLEAVALHHLDNLDAKIHSFQQLIRDDPNIESHWTNFNQPSRPQVVQGRPQVALKSLRSITVTARPRLTAWNYAHKPLHLNEHVTAAELPAGQAAGHRQATGHRRRAKSTNSRRGDQNNSSSAGKLPTARNHLVACRRTRKPATAGYQVTGVFRRGGKRFRLRATRGQRVRHRSQTRYLHRRQ